jgi:predicted transcriptional regulator
MSRDISDTEQSQAGQIFMELAGEVRRDILLTLSKDNLKLSQLAKNLDVTIQHIHSNVNRLIDIGLVEKTSDNTVRLTTYGKTIVKQLPTFHFLTQHKDYFQDHTFGDLPLKFERRIGDLNNCSVVRGVVAVLQRWKFMYKEATEYINTITTQVPVDLIESLTEKVRSGVKLSYIMPEDVIIPKGTSEILRKVSWDSLLAEKKAERKMVKRVLVSTIVTDKSACVLFSNLKNEIDMNVMFWSDDNVFREWCQDYFRYMWYASDLFDKRKVQLET